MTDTPDTDTDPGVVELVFCAACAADFVWTLMEALAKPYGGLDAPDWPARIHAEAPELFHAIEFILGPLLELDDPQHTGGEPEGESGIVH